MGTTFIALFTFFLGLACGMAAWWFITRNQQAAQNNGIHQLRESFQALSGEVLAQVSQQATQTLLTLAEQKLGEQKQLSEKDLDGKKQLIDQNLAKMNAELQKVNELVTTLEKNRHASFTTLTDQLAKSGQRMDALHQTTADLKATLSNSRIRGQWGERMAEDVLRLANFVEGINYEKQAQLSANESGGKPRPDFTFKLPQGHVVHMDVKFPLDQYLKYVEATSETDREAARVQFLKEARNRVREASKREYATLTAKSSDSTLDYSLVFIPNEQVYAFLMEHDRDLLDTAMQSKVILCSPTTLFAILAVIRQAMDSFKLQHTMRDASKVLGEFRQQWAIFSTEFSKLRKRFADVAEDFGQIENTRYKVMEQKFNKLDNLQLPDSSPTAEVIELNPERKLG